MSEDALASMLFLTKAYQENGFPNHEVWTFSFPKGHPAASELRALGLIKAFGLGGMKFVLTDAGQRWCMANRGP